MKNKQEIKQYARDIRAAVDVVNHSGHVLQAFIGSALATCNADEACKYDTVVLHELEALDVALLDAGKLVIELRDIIK